MSTNTNEKRTRTRSQRKRRAGRGRGGTSGEHGDRMARGNPQNRRRRRRRRGGTDQRQAVSVAAEGVLELHPEGYGFLRRLEQDCLPNHDDAYVSAKIIAGLSLRPGDLICGTAQAQGGNRGPRLVEVATINGDPASADSPPRREFETLTPIIPDQWLRLETGREPLTTRVIDLLVPVGKGQRGLIVAPPRSGKTVLLQHIGQAIGENHPHAELVMLLVDERPEEVTEMRRSIPGQVFASSLDHDVENHVRLSRLVVERCKRLAEDGRDVVLLVDSITRMARAFNKWVGNTGRTMTGGVDVRALDVPKRLFAAARAFEEGGSLTVVATTLVETGSRMDDVIFEEFKGTGNLEIVLDRRLADRRVWPAIDIDRSGTRREELLLDHEHLQAATQLRRALGRLQPHEAMQRLTAQLARHDSNADFLRLVRGQANAA